MSCQWVTTASSTTSSTKTTYTFEEDGVEIVCMDDSKSAKRFKINEEANRCNTFLTIVRNAFENGELIFSFLTTQDFRNSCKTMRANLVKATQKRAFQLENRFKMSYEMAVLACGVRTGPLASDYVDVSVDRAHDHFYDMHKNHTLMVWLVGTADEFRIKHAVHLFLGHLFREVPQVTTDVIRDGIASKRDIELGQYDTGSCNKLICRYGDAFLKEYGRIQNEHDTKFVDLVAAPDAAADAAVVAEAARVAADNASYVATHIEEYLA